MLSERVAELESKLNEMKDPRVRRAFLDSLYARLIQGDILRTHPEVVAKVAELLQRYDFTPHANKLLTHPKYRENKESVEALELLKRGVPGHYPTGEEAVQRGVERGLYTEQEYLRAIVEYPNKKKEFIERVSCELAQEDDGKKGKEYIERILVELLESLTPENFAQYRRVIENELFPSAKRLGIPVDDIETLYRQELFQSGDPDHPSEGRLHYIKEHLENMLRRVRGD